MTTKYAVYGVTETTEPKIEDASGSYLELDGLGDVSISASTGSVFIAAWDASSPGVILTGNKVCLRPYGVDALVTPEVIVGSTDPTDFWSRCTDQDPNLRAEGYRLPRIRERQTTDGSTYSVDIYVPNEDSVVYVETTIVAKTADGSSVAGMQRCAFFKVVGGTVTQVGTTLSPTADFGGTSWNADIVVDGTDIAVQITGQAATTIKWGLYTTYKTVRNGN